MTVTAEGLRVELLESEKGTFFDSGSSSLNKSGQEMLELLAAELGKVPNHISIEGHTDAKPFTGRRSYSNWELSADRANAARRLTQQSGFRPDQVSQVRGFADQRLRNLSGSAGPVEPAHFDHRAVHQQEHRRSGISRGGYESIGRGETVSSRREDGI
jgi:chemotaxis protein MotB